MSDSTIGLAQSIVASQAAATQGSLQAIAVRQQLDSDKAVANLVQQGAESQKAILPEGQGQTVDFLA